MKKSNKEKNIEKEKPASPDKFKEGQSIDLIIGDQTPLGYTAMIDHRARGILYKSEIFQKINKGQQIKGFIKKIRDDGKLDLCLEKPGYEKVADMAEEIIQKIAEQGGYIDITDKSSAERIYKMFGTSKKNFKKAVGALYKARRIVLEEDGISLSTD